MKWTAKKLASNVSSVCSLPTIHYRLSELVNDTRTSNRDVAKLISEDAGLTARLLRAVNSAFYGFPSSIDTVTRAVTVIGTRQLCDLVLMTSITEMFDGIPNDVVNMESFWRHSIACAVAARILASYRREVNVERFFVAGLLHDIGRLIIFSKMPDESKQVIRHVAEHRTILFKTEKDILGFDHAEVGRAMLEQWKLPEHLVCAVGGHHQPSRAMNPGLDAAIVHVAEIISISLQLGCAGEQHIPNLEPKAWERLNLPASVLPPTVKQLKRQFQDAVELILPGQDDGNQAA